ncbi:hypothetical protein FRB96_004443 [Tulasnella sp. 330]|nr:hypothetical protein FRB96_004443 [Tulasnella sp. 330]KAG8870968.1 hypothetical protein FRB97_009214 [Tulasnella sp. 331]
MARARWSLHVEAVLWRLLVRFGMWLHRLGAPWPLVPSKRRIPITISPIPGEITLYFFTPEARGKPRDTETRYPVLFTFHNSGFCVGKAVDDARWATTVVREAHVIVCAVDYRLAPEFPLPVPVDDCCDAVLWVYAHAEELGIDKDRMGLSGFSSGGNLAFTVPMRLKEVLKKREGPSSSEQPKFKIVVSWYPSLDYTIPRDQKTSPNSSWGFMELMMGSMGTFFDAAFLHPEGDFKPESQYLSPGVASDEQLQVLPNDICLYTCEFDGLHDEGERFRKKLEKLGRDVKGCTIMGAKHGYDRLPFGLNGTATKVYSEACQEIRRVLPE